MEEVIAAHPTVSDVLVVGRPSVRWGEEIVALVELASARSCTATELAEHASLVLARYKIPKRWVFVSAIERAPSGKPDYRWARRVARE